MFSEHPTRKLNSLLMSGWIWKRDHDQNVDLDLKFIESPWGGAPPPPDFGPCVSKTAFYCQRPRTGGMLAIFHFTLTTTMHSDERLRRKTLEKRLPVEVILGIFYDFLGNILAF